MPQIDDLSPSELLKMDLSAGDGDWQPTPHGETLARVLAENNLVRDREVLELGAGVANHTILLLRQGASRLVATEVLPDRIETTRTNVEHNCGQEFDDVIEYRVADWLSTADEFDVVVTNPPFCKSGKQNRRYFLDSLILDAHKRLRPGGDLVFVQSSMADLAKTQRRLEENGYRHEVLGQHTGPFRDYYFEDKTFMEESARVENGYELRDGVYYETLFVVRATLQPFTPPAGSHLP